ncbi:MAG: HPr family phosphocarrier protein [Proteobacteria bacterium]|nr:HPr family phosphocarrier protein [Pseudomonadota bacterium]MDA1356065.1 HPr family phosphocarrier protein [Pseudomonadota bacterium]
MSSHGEGAQAPGEFERRTCLIANRLGLHARAAAKFVRMAGAFDAEVWVIRNGNRVSGTSILGLMMLAAAPGTEITLEARGRETAEILAALLKLVDDKFDED